MITTSLKEQIIKNSIFRVCEILIDDAVLEANVIPLEMYDVDVILDMDWLSTHHA